MELNAQQIQQLWEKGRVMPDMDPTEWRQDPCGAWIKRSQYDQAGTDYGWRVIKVVTGKAQSLDDLQPYQWENNFDIANHRPRCRVKADQSGFAPGEAKSAPRNRRD